MAELPTPTSEQIINIVSTTHDKLTGVYTGITEARARENQGSTQLRMGLGTLAMRWETQSGWPGRLWSLASHAPDLLTSASKQAVGRAQENWLTMAAKYMSTFMREQEEQIERLLQGTHIKAICLPGFAHDQTVFNLPEADQLQEKDTPPLRALITVSGPFHGFNMHHGRLTLGAPVAYMGGSAYPVEGKRYDVSLFATDTSSGLRVPRVMLDISRPDTAAA